MLVPAVQYGDWAIVKKRMRRIATRIKRGESIVEVMTEDGMLDVGAHPGMMMMGGIMLSGWTSFHCFVPWKRLWQDLMKDAGAMDAIFQESMTVSWGVLAFGGAFGLIHFRRWSRSTRGASQRRDNDPLGAIAGAGSVWISARV